MVQRFVQGEKPATARDISNQLEIPIRFVNEILFNLVKSNILSMARTEGNSEPGYQPARDVNTLTVQYVVGAMDKQGLNQTPFTRSPEFAALSASLETFDQTIERQPENKLLRDL